MNKWQTTFDPATGRRVYRSLVARVRGRALSSAGWLLEIIGVGALAFAAWLVAPALAFVIVGAYMILAANSA